MVTVASLAGGFKRTGSFRQVVPKPRKGHWWESGPPSPDFSPKKKRGSRADVVDDGDHALSDLDIEFIEDE